MERVRGEGGSKGPVLEVITSRMRYISSQAAGKGQGSPLGKADFGRGYIVREGDP